MPRLATILIVIGMLVPLGAGALSILLPASADADHRPAAALVASR